MNWKGVMPAITTCFDEHLQVDHSFMARHCRWLLDNGCSGIVALRYSGGLISSPKSWKSAALALVYYSRTRDGCSFSALTTS